MPHPTSYRTAGRSMRRREFVAGLISTVPVFTVQAGENPKPHRIAVVDPVNPVADLTEAGGLPYYRGFFEELRKSGYVEGHNIRVDRFSGDGIPEHFPALAAAVVGHEPDLIFVPSTRLLILLKQLATTIPIVGFMADPIRLGIVSNLKRPGGNVTGVAHDTGIEFYSKRFELLKEAAPQTTKVGILVSQLVFDKTPIGEMTRDAARQAGLRTFVPIEGPYWREDAYRPAFAAMAREGVDALVATEANENWTYRRLVVQLAKEYRLPAIYPAHVFVELGGLIAYGADWPDAGRRAAAAAVQILKGANPGDIPVSQPTEFELSINLTTAHALGITVPASLLVRAEKVIE